MAELQQRIRVVELGSDIWQPVSFVGISRSDLIVRISEESLMKVHESNRYMALQFIDN